MGTFEQNLGKLGALLLALGAPVVALGIYFAPALAYEIQAPFRVAGVKQTGTVVATSTDRMEYISGTGSSGKRMSFDEHTVTVQLEHGTTTITHLVLGSERARLKAGDSVAVVYLEGGVVCRDRGSRTTGRTEYLLASSVDAGTFQLLGWSRGRGQPGKSIAGIVIGLFLCFIGGLFLWAHRTNRAAPSGA